MRSTDTAFEEIHPIRMACNRSETVQVESNARKSHIELPIVANAFATYRFSSMPYLRIDAHNIFCGRKFLIKNGLSEDNDIIDLNIIDCLGS